MSFTRDLEDLTIVIAQTPTTSHFLSLLLVMVSVLHSLLFSEELVEVFILKLLMSEPISLEKLKEIYPKILLKTQLQLLIMSEIMLVMLLA